MTHKEAGNFLVVGLHLLMQRCELTQERQEQAGFGSDRHRIRLQLRRLDTAPDLLGRGACAAVMITAQQERQVLHRCAARCFKGRIGLQERDGERSPHLGEQLQGNRIVRFETRSQLVRPGASG